MITLRVIESLERLSMKTYTIPKVAPIIAQTHGKSLSEVPTFERRLRHLVANGVLNVAHRDGIGPKARSHLSNDQAALASLLIYLGDQINFDIKLQRKVALAANEFPQTRGPGIFSGGALSSAIAGVANGDDWAMVLNLRADNSTRAHFVPLRDASLKEETENLLAAIGRDIIGRLVIGVSPLLRPFS